MAQPILVVFPPNLPVTFADLAATNQFTSVNRFGSLANFLQIDAAGHLSLVGGATVFDDAQVVLSNIKAPASDPPTWATYRGCELPHYGAGGTNALYFTLQFTHRWKEASSIEFHFHVAYLNALTGNSVWRFTYSWADYLGVFPAQTTLDATFAAPGIANQHAIHSFPVISGTGFHISSVLLCSLSRLGSNASDTYPSSIPAISADCHIEMDALGSNSEYVK